MTSFLSDVTGFIAAHPYLAYAAVLLLALSESIPVVGVVVPGTAVIVAISALVPSGVVMLWPLLVAAVAGAIIGDGLSFGIGHHYHRHILSIWPLGRYPSLIARSEAFFARHARLCGEPAPPQSARCSMREACIGTAYIGVVYREACDGSGSSRINYAAYWQANNDNPALTGFISHQPASRALSRATCR